MAGGAARPSSAADGRGERAKCVLTPRPSDVRACHPPAEIRDRWRSILSLRDPATAGRSTPAGIEKQRTSGIFSGFDLEPYKFGSRNSIANLRSLVMRYRRQESRFLTAAAIDRISADLNLAEVGQDWEIEAADSSRVVEFLDYYDTRQLDDDERFALMSLIVASFDERLSSGPDSALQERIACRLADRFDVLNYLVQYWALPDEDAMDTDFRFTSVARQVMQSKYGDRENWPRTPIAIQRAEKLLPEQGVLDSVSISDNRDGTFELWWSKTAVRDCGSREFTSINEATEFARLQFGIAVDAWCENK